jgi:hypothetical protein
MNGDSIMATIFTKLLKEAAAQAGLPFPEHITQHNTVEAYPGGFEAKGVPTIPVPDMEVGALPTSEFDSSASHDVEETVPQAPTLELRFGSYPYLAALPVRATATWNARSF